MLDRDQLETFATVAEQQSFERAAAVLNVTRGAVSQRIKALEESLATILLLRDKPVTPTPAGESLLRHVKALRLLEASSLRELSTGTDHDGPVPLSIAVNADSLATWFPPLLRELFARRLVALEVVTTTPPAACCGARWSAASRPMPRLPRASSPSRSERWSTAATPLPASSRSFWPTA